MTTPSTRKARTAEPAETPLPDELVPTPAPAPIEQVYAVLPVAQIVPGPHNPRHDLGDLDGLAASIRAIGVQEPLLVERPGPGAPFGFEQYQLLAGHRRLAAAKIAGLDVVPCMVRETPASPALAMEIALVENLQREELAPLDQAAGFQAVVDLGLSQRAIADRVGCSQALVSKRLSLLSLPSHVRARITKGTLPIEAAVALTKLVGHPDKLKAAAGEDPSQIVDAVDRQEARIIWEEKRSELVAVAKDKGWPVVDEPGWNTKRSFATLSAWNGAPELAIPVVKHQAEPCHGVMIPGDAPRWLRLETVKNNPPAATSVCIDPARHKPKGESALKAKVPPANKPRLSSGEAKERDDTKQRRATGAARVAFLTETVRNLRNTRGPSPAALTMTLRAFVRAANAEQERIACQLLGLDGSNHTMVLREFAAIGDHELHRAAFALGLATTESRLRWNWSTWSWDDVPPYYAYLAELGYQPSPWEQARLDEVAKRDAT